MEESITKVAQQYLSLLKKSKGEAARYSFPERITGKGKDLLAGELYGAYIYEVEARGRELVPDEATQQLVCKIGQWLATTRKTGLLLYGKVGTGKTTMMKAMYQVVRNGASSWTEVCYVSATNLVDQFLAYQDGKASRYLEFAESKILFIDDLGSEPVRCMTYGMERTPILDVLYHRYNQQLISVISTNLEDRELTERYGARMQDRMSETFDRLYYAGKSYRRM